METYNSSNTLQIPEEIKKWNWGAFMLNIYWGIGNKTYLTLLCLIPVFNFVWMFVCGFKGNEWAWKSNNYSNTKEFFLVQDTWNRAGFVTFIIFASFLALYFLIILFIIGIGFTAAMSSL